MSEWRENRYKEAMATHKEALAAHDKLPLWRFMQRRRLMRKADSAFYWAMVFAGNTNAAEIVLRRSAKL